MDAAPAVCPKCNVKTRYGSEAEVVGEKSLADRRVVYCPKCKQIWE